MRPEDSAVIRNALSVVDRFDKASKEFGGSNLRGLGELLEQAVEELRISLVRAGHKPSLPPD